MKATVREFFGTVLQQVCHFKVDVIAGGQCRSIQRQEHQDLHGSSVAVVPREMQREVKYLT